MTIGIWILGDQLHHRQAALASLGSQKAPIIMIESLQHVKAREYHKQKLVLVWSAMRHFAEELRDSGYDVTYKIADDFATPLTKWVEENNITEVRVMAPADKPFVDVIKNIECPITLIPNNHYLWTHEQFAQWARGRKNLLMEYFYREGRQRFNILMSGDKPTGGTWNYDKDNRQPPKGKLNTPPARWFEPDKITQEVIDFVNSLTIPTYGELKGCCIL